MPRARTVQTLPTTRQQSRAYAVDEPLFQGKPTKLWLRNENREELIMYVLIGKNTPYATKIRVHRRINMDSAIADRHVKRLNAVPTPAKKPLRWEWTTPEFFQQQLDQGKWQL